MGILAGLVSIDDRVRDRFVELVYGGGAAPWDSRLADLGDALLGAARHQSIENAPLVVFATAGALLFLFMVKT